MSLASEAAPFLRECFAFADVRQRGWLDLRDLKCAVAAALGIRASKLVLAQMFSQLLLTDGHSIEQIRVPREPFVAVLLPRVQKTDLLEHVRRSFKAFDLRAQGFISLASFERSCQNVLPHMSQKTMLELFREADRDGDGRVTYNDFEAIFLLGEQARQQLPPPRPHDHQQRRPWPQSPAAPLPPPPTRRSARQVHSLPTRHHTPPTLHPR